MSEGKTYNAALEVLDPLLRDVSGRHCGCVDDLELELEPGAEAAVTAVLTGPGARAARAPRLLGKLLRRVGGDDVSRVPWGRVVEVTSSVKLDETARELGLDRGERRPSDWVAKVPRS